MPVRPVAFGAAQVLVHPSLSDMARGAADQAADLMRAAVEARGSAHVMFATGNSQLDFVTALVTDTLDVPWADTVVFHMDEYVGVEPDHPAGFQKWIRQRIVEPASPRAAHYVQGLGDPGEECVRYANLLAQHPLDLCCLGIGENGHLAFNDPPVADFSDPLDVKVVALDPASRRQQVNEGHFVDLDAVPIHAITVTIPALLRARHVMAVVPEARKAAPVQAALTGPIGTACPASTLRTIAHATIHLEPESARLLP
ncbi:MAG TPA: glucosamine-6-phosphate deaminase [Acidimicrobiales bacterium]|jgi:glucosamine-6-phosphate deaminase|nr:glucosamine-6-phosphate deaminase [Acidimicrobiales bacterium]